MGITIVLTILLSATLQGSTQYLSGWEAEQEGRYADAFKAYESCATEEGPLQAYARARQAACRAASGDVKAALDAYERVLQEFPEGPWVRMIQANLAELHLRLGDHAGAMSRYEAVLSTRFRPWWMARLEWDAAEQMVAQPDSAARGHAFFKSALENPAYRGRRYDAAELLSKSNDSSDLWVAADALVRFGAVKRAEPLVLTLAPLAAQSPDTLAQWRYLQGRVLLGDGQVAEGRTQLVQVAEDCKGTVWAAKSLYQLVRSYGSGSKPVEADLYTERLLREYPGSAEAGDALWWRAGQLIEKEQALAAVAECKRLAALIPSHEKAPEALVTAGDLLRNLKKTQEALDAYETMISSYPKAKGRSEAAYWGGRLCEGVKEKDRAVTSYRAAAESGVGDYYAARALARLKKLAPEALPETSVLSVPGANLAIGLSPVTPEPELEPVVRSCSGDELERLRFFGINGLPEGEWEALYLAERQEGGTPSASLLTALADAGFGHTAIQIADSTGWGFQNGTPVPERLRIMYPRAYWGEVSLLARETGVDPYLLLSVARQESTFRASIASSAGAQGVMQLMPATANWLADKEPGVSSDHAEDLDNPSSSIRLGAYYLSRMIAEQDGNVAKALAAYNAGPGNVRKWLRARPGLDTEAFIETIPVGETRDYVKRVLGNLAAYSSVYGSAREAHARR